MVIITDPILPLGVSVITSHKVCYKDWTLNIICFISLFYQLHILWIYLAPYMSLVSILVFLCFASIFVFGLVCGRLQYEAVTLCCTLLCMTETINTFYSNFTNTNNYLVWKPTMCTKRKYYFPLQFKANGASQYEWEGRPWECTQQFTYIEKRFPLSILKPHPWPPRFDYRTELTISLDLNGIVWFKNWWRKQNVKAYHKTF